MKKMSTFFTETFCKMQIFINKSQIKFPLSNNLVKIIPRVEDLIPTSIGKEKNEIFF